MSPTLRISEIFGPTIQGEGPNTGRHASFIRLGGCNLDCRWCDTPYTWDWRGKNGTAYDPQIELATIPIGAITDEIMGHGTRFAVITGGEPLVQRSGLEALLEDLDMIGVETQIETNGTLEPTAGMEGAAFVVSPKLTSAGTTRAGIRPEILHAFIMLGSDFKFVACTPKDLEEIAYIQAEIGIPSDRIWIMPEGRDVGTIIDGARSLIDDVLRQGWNLTLRSHVLLWDNQRGV